MSSIQKTFKRWSDEELKLLEDNYKFYTNSELQKMFFPDRTIRSIECQAGKYGFNGKTEEAFLRSREYQKTDEWKNKISTSKKKYFETHDAWWKGKKRSEKQRKQISERRKGMWDGDKNPRHIDPLVGARNGNWKGGVLPVYIELRTELDDWKTSSMEFCNYKCVVTGGEFDVIHHTTAFKDIINMIFSDTGIPIKKQVMDYTDNEMETLRMYTRQYHIDYGYGACLNEDVHKLFHNEYGYTKFTSKNFIDFLNKINDRQYDDWFIKKHLDININNDYMQYLINCQ